MTEVVIRDLKNWEDFQVSIKRLQSSSKLQECMKDKTNKLHLYFVYQRNCQLCANLKKKFFLRLASEVNQIFETSIKITRSIKMLLLRWPMKTTA